MTFINEPSECSNTLTALTLTTEIPMAKAKNRIAEAEDRALETIYQDMMGTMDLLEILGASTLGIETICQTQNLMPALRSVAKQIYDRVSQHGAQLEMIQQNRAGEVKRIGGA